MLGERLTTLLSLISQDEYKTVDEFAQKMSLSTKTVRGLLQELNEQLQTHGAEVLHERGKGYRLKVQDLDKFQTIFLKADSNIPQRPGAVLDRIFPEGRLLHKGRDPVRKAVCKPQNADF